jgi:hypothetical protein
VRANARGGICHYRNADAARGTPNINTTSHVHEPRANHCRQAVIRARDNRRASSQPQLFCDLSAQHTNLRSWMDLWWESTLIEPAMRSKQECAVRRSKATSRIPE